MGRATAIAAKQDLLERGFSFVWSIGPNAGSALCLFTLICWIGRSFKKDLLDDIWATLLLCVNGAEFESTDPLAALD